MSNVAKQWADAGLELKQKYQNLIFPRGFIYDIKQSNFISQEISPLYRYVSLEMNPLNAKNSVMVNLTPTIYKELVKEINRWNEIMRGVYGFKNLTV